MRRRLQIDDFWLSNISWFLVALALAFFVWLLATAEADPIQERQYATIPIQIDANPDLTITFQSRETVSVTVRAPLSSLSKLTREDITVRAELRDLGAGTHSVELESSATRRADVDSQPRQVTVTLEEILTQQVPVVLDVIENPPAGYEFDEPVFQTSQVTVTGAASRIDSVTSVLAGLDLAGQRDPLEADIRLTPVDADGNPVSGVTLDPQIVSVTVPITLREDARIISVEPDIDSDSLPEGYDVTSISYDPKTIMVVGPEDALARLPDGVPTERITLEGITEDFEVSVPVLFDFEDLTLHSDRTISVSVTVTALEATEIFEEVPVTVVGLDEALDAALVTDQVTVFVSGPLPIISALDNEDISAVLDLNGLTPGTYDVALSVTSSEGQVESVSHPEITVTITEQEPEDAENPLP